MRKASGTVVSAGASSASCGCIGRSDGRGRWYSLAKAPAYQWYPGDFRRDTALQACSFDSRAIWREMLDAMHDGEPYGFFTAGGVPIEAEEFGRMCGVSAARVRKAWSELEARNVFSRNEEGVIYSRRMARDEEVRRKRAAGGVKGGNPALVKDRGKVGNKVNLPPNLPPTPAVASASASASASATAVTDEKHSVSTKPAGADVENSNGGPIEGETLHGYFMPMLRKLGYDADQHDGSILKVLSKQKKICHQDIEAAVNGLALMRDTGRLAGMGVEKGSKLSMRMLYAEQGKAARPLWREAEEEYYRQQPKAPRPHGMKPLAAVLNRVVNER